VRKQRIVLEHHADAPALGRHLLAGVLTSAPSSRISPASRRSKPAMQRSTVVLPQPDGPSRQPGRQHTAAQRVDQCGGGAGMLPVQRHVERTARYQFDQAPIGQLRRDQRLRVQAPAHAGLGGGDEGLRRRQRVPRQFHMAVAQPPHPAVLQFVLGVEHQAGRLGQAARTHAAGKVARHEAGLAAAM
jgi:hypothetical protein